MYFFFMGIAICWATHTQRQYKGSVIDSYGNFQCHWQLWHD